MVASAGAATNGLLAFQTGGPTIRTVDPVTRTTTPVAQTPADAQIGALPPATKLAVPGIPASRDSANPAWSPTGTQLAYSSTAIDGPTNIYVVNANAAVNDQSTLPRQVTHDPVAAIDPTWSPDGRQIAYTGFSGGDANIYVVDLTSRAVVQLTTEPSADQQADWSPDGAQIAFQSDRAGSEDIWLMGRDGSQQRALTGDRDEESDAEWKPDDGTRIAYSGGVAGENERDIYSIPATGGIARRLTSSSSVRNAFPAWSPDGREIAYSQDDSRLVVMPATGGNEPSPGREVSNTGTDPDWAILPPPTATASGDVTVKRPGSVVQQVVSGEPISLTTGTVVDTTTGQGGTVELTVNRPAASRSTPDTVATVTDAVVQVTGRTPESLALRIRRPASCPGVTAPVMAAKAKRKPKKAKVHVRTKKSKNKGKNKGKKTTPVKAKTPEINTSTLGTEYDVVVTCNGTYVRVSEGVVIVTLNAGGRRFNVRGPRGEFFVPRSR